MKHIFITLLLTIWVSLVSLAGLKRDEDVHKKSRDKICINLLHRYKSKRNEAYVELSGSLILGYTAVELMPIPVKYKNGYRRKDYRRRKNQRLLVGGLSLILLGDGIRRLIKNEKKLSRVELYLNYDSAGIKIKL